MQRVAVAEFRSAASILRSSDEDVTIGALARIIGVPPKVVGQYVKNITGLSEELGVVKKSSIETKYLDAIVALDERGVVITIPRIAFLTGSSVKSVKTWLARHQEHALHARRIVSRQEQRRCHMITLSKWVRYLQPRMPWNVTSVARCLGCERSALHRKMSQNPSLREELGL